MVRHQVLCFAVNTKSQRIEKIYRNRKSCENYAFRKDYEITNYYIHADSERFNKASMLVAGELYPSDLVF